MPVVQALGQRKPTFRSNRIIRSVGKRESDDIGRTVINNACQPIQGIRPQNIIRIERHDVIPRCAAQRYTTREQKARVFLVNHRNVAASNRKGVANLSGSIGRAVINQHYLIVSEGLIEN